MPDNLADLPPAVRELFKLLPTPGAEFPPEHRVQFMKAAACVFWLVYGPAEPIKIEIIPNDKLSAEQC